MAPSVRSLRDLLFLAAVLCLWVPPASAQVEVRIGVTEGGHFATLAGGDRRQVGAPERTDAELGRRPGLIIGGVAVLAPRGPFAVQSEVLWIWKGAKSTVGSTTTTTTLNYVEVPVLVTYRLPLLGGPLRAYLQAGGTVGLPTTAVQIEKTAVPSGPPRLTGRTDLGPRIRAVDLGWAVGGSVEYSFGDQATLTVAVRHRRSLTRALTGPVASDGAGPAPDVWNRGLALTLGFVYATGWTF